MDEAQMRTISSASSEQQVVKKGKKIKTQEENLQSTNFDNEDNLKP